MVQKVVGSIPITHPISECSTAVSIQVFQTWDESSILSTRTRTKKERTVTFFIFLVARTRKTHVVGLLAPEQKRKSIHTLYFFGRLYEKICEAKLLAPGYEKEEHLCSYFYDRLYEKIYL